MKREWDESFLCFRFINLRGEVDLPCLQVTMESRPLPMQKEGRRGPIGSMKNKINRKVFNIWEWEFCFLC